MRVQRGNGPKPFFAALGVTVIGVVWLVGGLAFNIFFYYPIILIIVGIIGMITNAKGLFSRQPQPPQQRTLYAAPPSQPMYYSPYPPYPSQPMPQMAPPPGLCWNCGRPNEGWSVCATCGAPQYSQPSQQPQPMAPYGTPPGYPPASGYPPMPAQPPATGDWSQPPRGQSW